VEFFAIDGIVQGRVAFVDTVDPVEVHAKDEHVGTPEAFAVVGCYG